MYIFVITVIILIISITIMCVVHQDCWLNLKSSIMRGLENYGYNCNINSVVQCLYATRKVRDYILQLHENDYHASGTVTGRLKCLIYEMTKDSHSPCDMSFLIGSLGSHCRVSFDFQEDSALAFKCILGAIVDEGGEPANAIGHLWDVVKEERVRCLGCNTAESTRSVINTIPVLMQDNFPDELQEYIRKYSDNTLAICNDYYCTTCHIRTQCEITSKVLSLPPAVCMTIARVINIGRSTTAHIVKTEKRFTFPETLDLKYMKGGAEPPSVDDALYELYAVIAHRGTQYCGHYTAYVQCHDKWYLADDSLVKLCSWEDVKTTYEAGSLNGVAYMLMYRKQITLH